MKDDRDLALAADADARRLAQTEFERPLVIEAGAGTGKTALLVARVVAWCVGPGWLRHADRGTSDAVARRVVERVVAITFTDAAAAEMAERVARALSDLASGKTPVGVDRPLLQVENDAELAMRARALADEVHRLQAQTIHSWCHHLLRAFPLEAGIHPRFEVDSDGTKVEEMVAEAVSDGLRALSEGADSTDWETLAVAGVMPVDLAEAAQMLVSGGVSTDVLNDDPCAPDAVAVVLAELNGALDAMTAAGLDALAGAGSKTGRVGAALVRLRSDLAAATAENPVTVAQALDRLENEVRERLRDWAKGKLTKTESGLASSAVALTESSAVLSPLLQGLRGFAPAEMAAARRVLAGIVGTVTGRLARSGTATFDDLLRLAAGLLESSDGVRREVRAGIDQLMVDEFQDTDDTQCRMVRSLALMGEEPGPGLFIVGDPKQSIYGWRRADLAAYDSFITEVKGAGGLVRPLVQNFRSTQTILDEVRRLVKPTMVKKEGIQPVFQHLEATDDRRTDIGFAKGHWTPVEHWVARPAAPEGDGLQPKVKVDDANAIEAVAVADDISRLLDDGGVEPKDVAILVRSTTSLEPLLDALRSAGVPFEVARERQYYQRREVVETAALVRSVIDPADQLALLTMLRSDAVGVPDAALAPLWDAGLPAAMARIDAWDSDSLVELNACIDRAVVAVPEDLPGPDALPRWPVALRIAARTVGFLRQAIGAQPPDVVVERLRTLWLNEATASARFLGRFRRARLERFFAELEGALGSDDGSLASVARMLRRAVDEGREPRAPGDPDVAADAVHVMTIHGAKGLDFEHVYLCQIHKGDPGGFGGSKVELRPGPDGLEYRLFGWPTPGFGAADRLRHERERAERVRLLYVATTRAKNRLVVSGRWQSDGEPVSAEEAGSFEDLVGHRVPLGGLEDQVRESDWRRSEKDRPVQWVLPALDPDRGGASGKTSSSRGPYDLGRVRREADLLARRRTEATARSALPVSAAASSLVRGPSGAPTGADERALGQAAAAAGTAVHRLLETIDLESDLAAQIEQRRDEVLDWAAAESEGSADLARRRAAEVLEGLLAGRCLATLAARASDVVARELPLLVPAGGHDPAVSVILGVADLVYRRNGRVVVADYKTDALRDDAEIAARAEHYRPQLDLYARAVGQALDVAEPPVAEIWFLSADRIVEL